MRAVVGVCVAASCLPPDFSFSLLLLGLRFHCSYVVDTAVSPPPRVVCRSLPFPFPRFFISTFWASAFPFRLQFLASCLTSPRWTAGPACAASVASAAVTFVPISRCCCWCCTGRQALQATRTTERGKHLAFNGCQLWRASRLSRPSTPRGTRVHRYPGTVGKSWDKRTNDERPPLEPRPATRSVMQPAQQHSTTLHRTTSETTVSGMRSRSRQWHLRLPTSQRKQASLSKV